MTVILILNISDKEEAEKRANAWLANPKIKVIDFSCTERHGDFWSLTINYEEVIAQETSDKAKQCPVK